MLNSNEQLINMDQDFIFAPVLYGYFVKLIGDDDGIEHVTSVSTAARMGQLKNWFGFPF